MQSEIPADVMMNAERLYDDGGYKTVPEIIAEAVMAERERCTDALSAAEPPPAPSVAVKALEEAFKHFKVVYDPPNGISINEATRAEAIKLASSALCSTLSKVEIETLVACEDWKANFEIMRIRGVDNTAEAWRSSQRVVDNLLDRGLLEFGKPNTTYRITDAGRSALSAQVQEVAVAEIVSAHGDPEAFGERELVALIDIQKFPYRTKLYAAAPAVKQGEVE